MKEKTRTVPKYTYDNHIITSSLIAPYARLGLEFICPRSECELISRLDAQRESGKTIFGNGYIVSDRVAIERERIERERIERERIERERIERERIERERIERERATKWELSERELSTVKRLSNDGHNI